MHRELIGSVKGIGADTAIVAMLLAFEFGRAVVPFTVDGALMSTAIVAVIAMPYFFAWTNTDRTLSEWLLIRSSAAIIGAIGGMAFSASVETVMPVAAKFIPMMILLLAVAISGAINASGFLRLQLAK